MLIVDDLSERLSEVDKDKNMDILLTKIRT